LRQGDLLSAIFRRLLNLRQSNLVISCKAGGPTAGFIFEQIAKARAFISHSRNKTRGTGNRAEHRISAAVVGAGNANM
jgi:hypothetical protein